MLLGSQLNSNPLNPVNAPSVLSPTDRGALLPSIQSVKQVP